VLLLDGLDETQNPNAFLDLIRELTRGQGKLIVATRPRRLSTEHLPRSSARVTIQPLSDEQVERLARLRYGTGAERLLDDLHSSPELARLVRTPLLAQIVLDNHAALNSRPGLSPGVLIDEITSSWLAASNIGDREREIWRILLRDIAWSQWESSREEFSSNELASAWLRLSDPDTPAAEALDVASQCPLLVRGRAGKFRFAHRLFAEFFLAEGLRDAVAQHSAWRLQVSRLTEGVIAFLHGFEVSVGDIQWLANLLTEGSLPSVPGASENALLILRALAPDRSIEGADLSGDDLSGLNLDGVSLPRANLRGALLTGTSLKGANLESADLSGADLRGATLSKARTSAARLGDADLLGADLSGADLSQTGLEPDDSRG
jgi:hypothetical protein